MPDRGECTAARVHGRAIFATSSQGECMNKDQVKGTLKDAAGKVQETTGKVIGSTEQQLKGIHKQVEGKTQKAVGDVKEVLKDITHK
jgi:uncharacterized protein YjbJ (UPF0337 family)